MTRTLLLFAIWATLLTASTAHAQEPVIALHAGHVPNIKAPTPAPTEPNQVIGCGGLGDPISNQIPCTNYNTTWPAFTPAGIFIMLARADSSAGFAAASFGISYTDSVGIFGWVLCADEEFTTGAWPLSEGGNRVLWNIDNCQRSIVNPDGAHAIAGWIYIYAYGNGTLELTGNTGTTPSEFLTADCAENETTVLLPGPKIGFKEIAGFNPCEPTVPVTSVAWGRLKRWFH